MVLRSACVKTILVTTATTLAACAVMPSSEEPEESNTSALSTCGNGVRETDEQCDDGAKLALDGCSAKCKFEQVHRFNSLQMQFGTDALCTVNALGGAVGAAAQKQLGDALGKGVADGTASALFLLGDVADLSGTSSGPLTLGSFVGDPVKAPGYAGAHDLDWWYTPLATTLGPDRAPLASLSASITNKVLTAGPGDLAFSLALGGSVASVSLSNVRATALIGPTSAPSVAPSAATATSGHLAAEHLDPALVSFETTTDGQLCGNVSAASLAALPAPPELQVGGSPGCNERYTAQSTMLDVFTSGCRVLFFSVISPIQPDQTNPSAPAAGAGAPYKLVTTNKHVTGCTDKNGQSADLDTCLAAAAFSTSFKFTTGRVIARAN